MPSQQQILHDQLIPLSGVPLEHVLNRLNECGAPEWKEFLNKSGQNQFAGECHVESISGIGYLSCIWRLRLLTSIGQNGGQHEFRAIFKSPNPKYVADVNLINTKQELDFLIPLLVQFHDREVLFYSELVPKFLSGAFASDFLPRPFAWECATDVSGLERAFLLLEDLSERAKPPTEADNLSKEQIEALLKAIAELHANSYAIPEHQMRSLWLAETHLFKYSPDKVIERLCAAENVGCCEFFKANHDLLGSFIEEVLKAKERGKERDICSEFGIRPVLTHGDLWSSNLLFRCDNPNQLAAIVDWQFTQPDTGLNDLAHLFMGSVDVELRQRHQGEWFELYHSEMHKRAEPLAAVAIPNVEQMERIFKRHLPRELYFQMQMLVLNEEAGESAEHARRRQNRIRSMFPEAVAAQWPNAQRTIIFP